MSHAEPPKPAEFTQRLDWRYVAAYRKALYASKAENARAIRRRILNGPADLQREIALTRKAGIATTPAELKLPTLADGDNAMPDLLELQALLEKRPLGDRLEEGLTGTEKLSEGDAAALKKALAECKDVFTLIEKAASREGLVMRTDWSPEGFAESSKVYRAMRTAATLLSARAILAARDGNLDGAVKDLEWALRLGALTAQDPLLMSGFVSLAMDAISVRSVGKILSIPGADARVNAAVRDVLERNPPKVDVARALEGEVVFSLASRQESDTVSPRELAEAFDLSDRTLDPDPDDPPIPEEFAPADRRFVSDLLDAIRAESLPQTRTLVLAARKGLAACREAAEVQARAGTDDDEGPIDPVEAEASVPGMGFPGIYTRFLQPAANRATVIAGATVLAHKARTSAWPETLAEARETPKDPWTGRPLGYRREGDGFVVWSAGESGKFTASPGQSTTGEVSFRYPSTLTP